MHWLIIPLLILMGGATACSGALADSDNPDDLPGVWSPSQFPAARLASAELPPDEQPAGALSDDELLAGEQSDEELLASEQSAAEPECIAADLLWFEDFETGDYSRWTGSGYGRDWGDDCQDNGFSEDRAVSGRRSHRSEVTCRYEGGGDVHRGYGGLQFSGDEVMEIFTNDGVGIDAPHGVVVTFWSWLETSTEFSDGTWFSSFTVNNSCSYDDHVMTLGLEDHTMRQAIAHHWWNGGSRDYASGAPSFPLGQWVRTTIYLNYYEGFMQVWQDGQPVTWADLSRDNPELCQFHWGIYASADNDDIVLYEDDISVWKLQAPWPDFDVEPWIDGSVPACANDS